MVILMVNGQKVFLGWKLSPIINRLGRGWEGYEGWNKNVQGGKKSKNYLAGERPVGAQECF